ncbi:hypothetical protein D3C71_1549570 [compost metagenome]
MFEVNVILELTFRQQLNVGLGRNKQPLVQPGIGIADIFRRQRKQHAATAAVGIAPGKQVKQVEKRALAAICQCNVLWRDLPAQLIAQQISQRFQQGVFALRAVIVTQRLGQFALIEHVLAQLFEVAFHLWNLRRITAAEHDGTGGAQAFVQVIH